MSIEPEPGPPIHVVNFRDIPSPHGSEASGAALQRFFHHNQVLSRLLPSADNVAFAWTHLRPGETLQARSTRPLLLVVCRGTAELTGAVSRPLAPDEVVAIPAGSEYGVEGVGADGFHAISIEFDSAERAGPSDAGSPSNEAPTLEGLLLHSKLRLQQSMRTPFFTVLTDGTLDVAERRRAFFDCIEAFSQTFQTIIFGRQATCRDESFAPVFLAHFRDELGHDELLAGRTDKKPVTDPVVLATASWFAHQMYVVDNVEKAVIVHLVLEEAGHHFHSLARQVVDGGITAAYHDVHAENDDEHTEMGIGLLEGLAPSTYRRLHRVLDDAWDMFDTMGTRIALVASKAG